MRSRDVRNFNMLLNMSDHVLIYCSWGQGTQKKNSAFNSCGKQWHQPRPFFGHSFNRQNNENCIIYHDATIIALKPCSFIINGRKAFCLMLVSSLYDHCFTRTRPATPYFHIFYKQGHRRSGSMANPSIIDCFLCFNMG